MKDGRDPSHIRCGEEPPRLCLLTISGISFHACMELFQAKPREHNAHSAHNKLGESMNRSGLDAHALSLVKTSIGCRLSIFKFHQNSGKIWAPNLYRIRAKLMAINCRSLHIDRVVTIWNLSN
ncbi:hypothetical protein VNO77_03299 [Canavalia gladiata]|uniref:Uncharacterized protein n=1 Tax=Canavalia gladiata TaxID=3824 RepID=A0AAN9R6R8_CANGL